MNIKQKTPLGIEHNAGNTSTTYRINLLQSVVDDMTAVGIKPSKRAEIRFDTPTIIRFHVEGDKQGSKNGYWRGFSDGIPAGFFGSWKSGEKFVWVANYRRQLSKVEWDALQTRIDLLKSERDSQQSLIHGKVANLAKIRFMSIPVATGTAYSKRKHIKPINAKQYGNVLVLALSDWSGKIWSLQSIYPNGLKLLMKGGRKKGLHIHIGGNPRGRLMIFEGYATAVSMHMMDVNSEIIAAIDAMNMKEVAITARKRFPDREIVLGADHDPVGIKYATAAARAVGGLILVPPEYGQDWNDYFIIQRAK